MPRSWVMTLLLMVGLFGLGRLLQGCGRLPYGRFLGIPYDLRLPTPSRLRERMWNREDSRALTPMVFGWGYTLNLPALPRRLGLR